ncbi:MAG TPA: HlyD family efflux transporter periplasmic adaptor subunit [Cellvibrio sp.]|nr:HlyD family efflux transporter periplasmic adaptor subunit [Cellvibrio sp.]
MTTSANLNIVHESEAQRQYARLRIPAKIAVKLNGTTFVLPVQDISAGGFSIGEKAELFKLNDFYEGNMEFTVDGFTFSITMKFSVKNINTKENRVGCELSDMGPREIASLRYLLTSTLNGELFSTGDMLNTLARENFTKARNKHGVSQQSTFQRTKASVFSAAFFCIGLAAFAFVAKSVYDNLLLIHATTAKVERESFVVTMPREGEINSLVKIGQKVTKGQPIATIKAPLADFLGATVAEGLSPALINEITKSNVAGSINSPCDCVINNMEFTDTQYLAKGANLFNLSAPDAPLFARAWFDFTSMKKIGVGKEVSFHVPGSSTTYSGKVAAIKLPVGTNGPLSQIEVKIELAGNSDALVVDQPLLISTSRF